MLVRLVQALALNSNSWQQHANVSSNQYIRSILEWNMHSYILYLYTYIHACIHTYGVAKAYLVMEGFCYSVY